MNRLLKDGFLWTIIVAVVSCFGAACRNTAADEDWPPPVQEEVDDSPVLSPEEALQTFSVPPGFRVELVAAEPLIHDPVAIDIDPDGRIWAAEMRGYMTKLLDSDGDYQRKGQIVVLEDIDSDGKMDQSTVFMDSLNLPRGVLVLKEGVLIAEPPHLWLARDTDGDLRADEKIAVRGDYGIARGNPESSPNSPTWGMDNWIHNTHYPGRFRYEDGAFTYDSTLALGQWGLSMDDYGRLYRNSNSVPLRVAMLDAHYYTRNANMIGVSGADVRIAKEAREVWPIRSPTWVDRGYREGVLREDSTLRTFTAASGPTVYRGDRYPEAFQGDVFVPEPAAHLVRRFAITEHEDGTMEAANAYDKAEFMASTDERFRPVNGYSAPDGTLYVVDMYKGVITWRRFITQYLKHHIEERNLMSPNGLGRIYRVVYEEHPPGQEKPRLTSQSNRALVEYLDHPNGWWRDAAQQLLVERGATEAAPVLRGMALSADGELTRLHALWTLEGLGELEYATVRKALQDESRAVRAAAVRLAEPWLREGDADALQDVAALVGDAAPAVRLQLAASLGEVPERKGEAVLAELVTQYSEQPYLLTAVLTGLEGRELPFMRRLMQAAAWRQQQAGYHHALQTLAATIIHAGDPDQIDQMLQFVGDQADAPKWQRLALLDGFEELIPEARGEFARPLKLTQKPTSLARARDVSDPEVREKVRQIADRLVWPGKPGYSPPASPLLTAEAKRRFAEGEQVYQEACATCHQLNGQGQEEVSASLVGSEWVLGQEKDVVRIVLGGKEGETGLMPPQRNILSNEEVAAVVTYIRNAWENEGTPISPSLVEEVRKATAAREQPWTDEELQLMIH